MSKLAGAAPSRRDLVIGAAVVGGALTIGACSPTEILGLGAKTPDFGAFGPFLTIGPDGAVTVIAKHIELGQGSQSGLAAIVAEELDADWGKVRVQSAPANVKLYANTAMGIQLTGGSTAIANSWEQLRKAGATARALIVAAAAAEWNASPGEIDVKDGVVAHAASGRSANIGAFVARAGKLPVPASPTLKDKAAFTLIGGERVRRLDSKPKSTGATIYTQDVQLPGMLTAVAAHSPRFGGKLKSFDASAAKKVAGVIDVFKIPTGVAVVAKNTWSAMKGREALKTEWDDAKAETRSSDAILSEYKAIAANPDTKWESFVAIGDAGAATGADALSFSYDFPYLAHAAMEPMNCVATVNGNACKLTFASQAPTLDQLNAAMIVGNLPANIEVETLPAGGSFGRRAVFDSDYVAECVHIAKKVGASADHRGAPVKLVWTREDDQAGGKYRPMAHHAIKVTLGGDGMPEAWAHRIVIQSFMKGSPMGGNGVDSSAVEGALGSPYFKAIPNVDGAVAHPKSPVTTSWWRSVGATHTALAMEHTIDQLARKAGKDPVAYRRAFYERAGAHRHLAALDLAVEKAGWGKPMEKGWAQGVAVHESFNSVVANIAEVALIDGEPRVRRVICAIDCGLAIAPDQVRAQMEGALCYGLGAALYGAVTLKDGVVEQTNFDTYRVLRIHEAPIVETHIVPSAAAPTGVGEPGTPVIIPAVANALLALGAPATTSLPWVKA